MPRKIFLNEKKFIELHKKGLKERELSVYFKVSRKVVSRYKKELSLEHNPRSKQDINKIKELVLEGFTDSEIAEKLDIKKGTVCYVRIHNLDIRHSDNKNRIEQLWNRKHNYYTPNNIEERILLGTLLGDASISKSSSLSARGSFSHCLKQEEYARYKAKLLKNLTGKISYKENKEQILNGRYIKPTTSIQCKLNSSPYLLDIYNLLYPNNKKTITKEYINRLDITSVAFYYFDDGSLSKDNTAIFHMYAFSKEEKILFSNFLLQKYNIYSTCSKNTVRISKKSANLFFELIKPYCVNCMKYKLPK